MPFLFFICLFCFSLQAYSPFLREAYLTSSFGESRGNRYHAGVDYSTEMKEGLPITAPENGMVEEVRISPFGYGKVIFFKGESGKTWVFAHLSSFTPRLDSLIFKEQFRKKQNDLTFKKIRNLNFQKGDTLVFSGSSGIGNPHLHLEIRDGKNTLLSPCASGVVCLDTIPPFILGAAVWNQNEVRLTSEKSLQNHCVETPENADSVWLSFKIADYSREPFSNPMSIQSIRLFSEKEKLFERTRDTLFYNQMIQIREELLWAEEADTAGDWHFIAAPVLNFQKLSLEVEDFSKNKTLLHFSLQKSCKENIGPGMILHQDSLLFTFLSRSWMNLSFCKQGFDFHLNTIGNEKISLCENYPHKPFPVTKFLEKNSKAKSIQIKHAGKEQTVFLYPVSEPEESFETAFPEGKISQYFSGVKDVSFSQVITVRKIQTDSLDFIEIHPKGFHFTGKFQFCADTSFFPEKLYWLGETTRKWFIFSQQEIISGMNCAKISEIRDIAAILDTTAPQLGKPYWDKGFIQGIEQTIFRIPVIEKGSGIPHGNAISVFIRKSDFWIPAEYDSEPGEIILDAKRFSGEKQIKILIEDEMGNKGKYYLPISP